MEKRRFATKAILGAVGVAGFDTCTPGVWGSAAERLTLSFALEVYLAVIPP